MERTNKGNELRVEGNPAVEAEGREMRAMDVRALADLELMLVGGGDISPDWGH